MSSPVLVFRDETAAAYRRPTWQEALAQYLPPRWRGARAQRWINRLPLLVILGIQAGLALRLSNTAFIDEALYINAGRDYLNHWLHGAPTGPYGDSFSGAPLAYPVIAGVLDVIGGLRLARLLSLLCMAVTMLGLHATVKGLHSARAGLLAAAGFAATGPVAYLGALATFDAACVMLLAVAAWLGITGERTPRMGAAVGAVLAVAVVVKYTAAPFVPAVIALIALTSPRWSRAVVGCAAAAVATTAGLLGTAFMLWGDGVRAGIAFTTTARAALSPTPKADLVGWLVLNLGVLLVPGAVGAVLVAARSLRWAAVVTVLLAAAALLPAAQLRLGEAVSFDKHNGYAALFLAPLAGITLARLSRGLLGIVPVVPIMALALLVGYTRSDAMFSSWANVRPVLHAIEQDPQPGIYLSSATDALKYHLRADHPDIRWETTFELYVKGPDAIRAAVAQRRFQSVILRTASTGSPDQDAGQQVLLGALRPSPDYALGSPLPVRPESPDRWLIFVRRSPA